MASILELRSRIKSVNSTKKITKAQELIATSRITKAQIRVAASKPYAEEITKVLTELASASASLDHPLLNERPEPKRAAVLVVTSDRGMCGGYNSNVLGSANGAPSGFGAAGKPRNTCTVPGTSVVTATVTMPDALADVRSAVNDTIAMLDAGTLRVAEKRNGQWQTNEWAKKAVLLSFRLQDNAIVKAGDLGFYDKVQTKFAHLTPEEMDATGVRVVPPAVARRGSFIAKGAILIAAPLKIERGTGSPIRALALVPKG